jgi:hypothetical protein
MKKNADVEMASAFCCYWGFRRSGLRVRSYVSQLLLRTTEATRMRTNCQLQLRRSVEPSRLSFRRQWILHSLRTPLESPSGEEVVTRMSCPWKPLSLNETILKFETFGNLLSLNRTHLIFGIS